MGNHLSCIAHGIGIQLWALQKYNLSTQMVLRHQTIPLTKIQSNIFNNIVFQRRQQQTAIDSPKWIPTSQTMKQCFPVMADWDFSMGSQWKEFDQKITIQNAQQQQQQEYDPSSQEKEKQRLFQEITKINGKVMVGRRQDDNMKEPITIQDIDDGLSAFVQLWKQQQQQQQQHKRQQLKNGGHTLTTSSELLANPFLYSDSMDNMIFIERYLPYFRRLFRIDPSCCGTERPDPDESVFVSGGVSMMYEKSMHHYLDTKFTHLFLLCLNSCFSIVHVVVV
jgi:hypothetical protein